MNIKSYCLKCDIVIPAGTIFTPADGLVEASTDAFACTIGLSKDSWGVLCYYMDDPSGLEAWFDERQKTDLREVMSKNRELVKAGDSSGTNT